MHVSGSGACWLQMVFAEVALGSMLLTINVILLGGEIVFTQAVCLFGYCLFPLCVAAIVCASTSIKVPPHACTHVCSPCGILPLRHARHSADFFTQPAFTQHAACWSFALASTWHAA